MRIAIAGGGLCGLAVAWFLLSINHKFEVTLFDPNGIGGGASGIAAGLLHPFGGAWSNLNPHGREGMKATVQLIKESEKQVGYSVAKPSGLLRPAISEHQQHAFAVSAKRHEEVSWYSVTQCQELIPSLAPFPGIFINTALTVDIPIYLKGLWQACEQMGATFQKSPLPQNRSSYDAVILTVGGAFSQLSECQNIPLTPVKGQLIEIPWNEKPLPFPISSQAFVIPGENSCLVGSTYEKNFMTENPVLDVAKALILPKLAQFFPHLVNTPVIDCRAGIRVSTPDHLPILEHINKHTWILTGMGSKGLLYHALYAEKLANQIARLAAL